MQREVIKWLQSLDLSHPVRNPRRDFSNGFIAAEIVCRYFDERYLSMRGISQSTSPEARRRNWEQVYAALCKVGCRTVTPFSIQNVIGMNPNAANNVLEHMYEFFTKKLLPMRTIDGNAPTSFLKGKDAPVITALLYSVHEGEDQTLTTKKEGTMDPVEQQGQNQRAITVAQNMLAVGRNTEIAGGIVPLLRPRYSHQTASSLIHQANHKRYHTTLHQSKNEPDALESQKRNEHIIEQHRQVRDILTEADERKGNSVGYGSAFSLISRLRGRYYAAVKGPHTEKDRRRRRGNRGRRGNESSVEAFFHEPGMGNSFLAGGTGRRIEVNVLSQSLMNCLENNGIYLNRDARAGEKSIEFFTSCEFSIRKAFSAILKDVLVARKELIHIFERSVKSSEGDMLADLFTCFIAQRDFIPMETLEACWTALVQNTSGVAAAISLKPEEYGYILQTLHFLFTLEASQMHVLHVSGPREAENTRVTSAETMHAPSSLFAPLSGRNRSQSISHALLGGWGIESKDEAIKAALDPASCEKVGAPASSSTARRPRAQWSNRQLFHYASAFVLLEKIAEALQECNPGVSEMVLEKYFLPAALPFLIPYGRPGMVEAVGRVIVAFLMGPSTAHNNALSNGEDDSNGMGNEEYRALTQHRLQGMGKFLECVLQPLVINEEPLVPILEIAGNGVGGICTMPSSLSSSSCRETKSQKRSYLQQRYYFLVYNVMRQTLAAYTWESNILRALAAEKAPSPSTPTTCGEGRADGHPLEVFASNIAVRCLSSESSVTRATGIAITTMLLFWDAWIPFISIVRQFILSLSTYSTVRGSTSRVSRHSRFSVKLLFSSHSYEFEGRILTLGLLCLLFKKIVLLVCDDNGITSNENSNMLADDHHIETDGALICDKLYRPPKKDNAYPSSTSSFQCSGSQGMISQQQKEYHSACKKVLESLPFAELDLAATEYLRSFSHAPLKQRQLALAVVGQHLLPDGHPHLASVWLRLVCSLPSPHANSVMTLPFSSFHLEMRRPSAAHFNENRNLSRPPVSAIVESEAVLPSDLIIPSQRIPTEKMIPTSRSRSTSSMSERNSKLCRGVLSADWNESLALSDSPDASPIGLLFGQVSPAYSLVPLNQVWDTYSVVHVVLRYLNRLDPIKTLEIIAAALLSPREQDSQMTQLLRNFQFSSDKEKIVGEGSEDEDGTLYLPCHSGSHCLHILGEDTSEERGNEQFLSEDHSEGFGALTLRDLVLSSTGDGENPFLHHSVKAASTHSGLANSFPLSFSQSPANTSAEEEDQERRGRVVNVLDANTGSDGRRGELVVNFHSLKVNEHRLCKAFWYTTLQRLEPVITSQLPSLVDGEKTFEELSHGEQLSFAVLKTLYYRYVMDNYKWVETSPSILVDSLREAVSWLHNQKAMW